MILAVAQTKGGVGKTTLAINLVVDAAVRRQRDVLLVDADEQATASDFVALRGERLGKAGFTAVQLTGPAVRGQVLAMRGKFDDIVIDAGGRDTTALRAALTVADLAILPYQPRSFDIWTLDKMARLVAEAQTINPVLRAYALINCADAAGVDNEAAARALSDNPHIAFLDTPIGRRKSFPNCNALGLSVFEMPQPDAKACRELAALADALVRLAPPGGAKNRPHS